MKTFIEIILILAMLMTVRCAIIGHTLDGIYYLVLGIFVLLAAERFKI